MAFWLWLIVYAMVVCVSLYVASESEWVGAVAIFVSSLLFFTGIREKVRARKRFLSFLAEFIPSGCLFIEDEEERD